MRALDTCVKIHINYPWKNLEAIHKSQMMSPMRGRRVAQNADMHKRLHGFYSVNQLYINADRWGVVNISKFLDIIYE